MTRICAYCNTENQDHRSHCESCGAVLTGKETALDKQEAPKAVYETLLAICEKYDANEWCNTVETFSPKKRSHAIEAFDIPQGERVIMLYDDTLFGSNNLGFAVCESGLYWKNSWHTPTKRTKLTWEQYLQREIALNGFEIDLGRGDKISVATQGTKEREMIAELLQQIRAALATNV